LGACRAPPRWRLSIISEQDATTARNDARAVARSHLAEVLCLLVF
jgi:hypothetical protein